MTDDDRATGQLGTLLHERVQELHPDLDALVSTAILAGSRLRRRRRLTVASTTLGGVAAGVVLAGQLWPAPPTPAPSAGPVGFAAAPSPHPSPADGCPTALRLGRAAPPCLGGTPEPQDLPVSFEAPGWTCDPPADDKFECSEGANGVLVTLRPARFHSDYLNDPDKASPDQFVSDVHDGVFATVLRFRGNISVDQLADYLVWN